MDIFEAESYEVMTIKIHDNNDPENLNPVFSMSIITRDIHECGFLQNCSANAPCIYLASFIAK